MVLTTSKRTKMARRQGASDDRGVSSSRRRKTQACGQTNNSGKMDLAWTEGREHCCAPDGKSEEKKRAVGIDQPNVNYKNATGQLEDI